MPPQIDALTVLSKTSYGDIVNRDAYIRSRIQTGVGSVINNDYYFTDGTTPTLLAGEYISYNDTTKEGSYHIFAKGAGTSVSLDTTSLTNASISVGVATTTLRSATAALTGNMTVAGTGAVGNVAAVETTGLTAENIMVNPGDEAGNAEILLGRGTDRTRMFKDTNGHFNIWNEQFDNIVFTTGNVMRMAISGSGWIGMGNNPVTNQRLTLNGNVDLLGTGNVYRIAGTPVLSQTTLGTSVTTSSLTSVGILDNLTVSGNIDGNIIATNARIANTTYRTFIKTLGSNVNDNTIICNLTSAAAFVFELAVVQSLSGNAIAKYYKGTGQWQGTGGAWKRLIPLSSTGSSSSRDWAVDISITNSHGSFRLVRTDTTGTGGTTSLVCALKIYNPAGAVVVVDSTESGTDAVNTGYFESTLITQVDGMAGIGTDSPLFALDVVGDTNLSTGNVYRIGTTEVLSSTALGTTVTSSSLTGVGTLATLDVSGNVNFTGTTATFTASGPVVLTNTSVAGNVAAVETTGLTAENIMVNPGDATANAELSLTRGANQARISQDQGGNVVISNAANQNMFFATNNTTRVTINGEGNMGIGGNPSGISKLNVQEWMLRSNGYRVAGLRSECHN